MIQIQNQTPSDIQKRFSGELTEQELADAFAMTENQFWWVEDNEYDFEEGTPEHTKACEITDAWGKLSDSYRKQIFAILEKEGVTIPKTNQIKVLEPFMRRNGYIDGQGWWIKEETK